VRPIETPKYQQIADELQREIRAGEPAPGEPMPTIEELKARFQVSDRTIVEAERVLLSQGLIVSKPGTRTYVRTQPQPILMTHSWASSVPPGSPWRAMMAAVGRVGDWTAHSTPVNAPPEVAERLHIEPAARVIQTEYVFTADNAPAYLSTSWEPMAITAEPGILLPESGPLAGRGVVERMAAIGVVVTRETHDIDSRPLTEPEAAKLGLRAGVTVVVKVRTYWAGETAVETAEIVLPPHVRLRYELPVNRPE
jgi:GntR family transcriptional regulator